MKNVNTKNDNMKKDDMNRKSKIKRNSLCMGGCAARTLSALCGCSGQQGGTEPAGVKKLSGAPAPEQGGSLPGEASTQGGAQADGASVRDVTAHSQGSGTPADASTVTEFSLRLFQESLSQEQKKDAGKNVLVSPASVLFALSMTSNGADQNTLAQMEEVLGASVPELNAYLHEYRTSLPMGDGYKLSIANSVWFKDNPDFTVNQDFLAANEAWYDADIYQAAFDASTLKAINRWVSDSTDEMIPEILDSISADAVMYLINGIAFDAEWSTVYREYQVREADFTQEDGTVCRTELMYANENAYLRDANAQGFLKYYKDGKYAFAALLPNEGVTVSEYVKSLDAASLREMLSNPANIPVKTAIPKFEAEYNIEMSGIFKTLGMTDAFDANAADFSRLGEFSGKSILINRILHKTYIAVDERGTKAGAATAVEVNAAGALMPQEEKEVYLDRPFVYLIIDCEENIPVFMGTLMNVK